MPGLELGLEQQWVMVFVGVGNTYQAIGFRAMCIVRRAKDHAGVLGGGPC